METLVIIFIVVIILGALLGGKSFGGTIKNGIGCLVLIVVGLPLLILIVSSNNKPESDDLESKVYSVPQNNVEMPVAEEQNVKKSVGDGFSLFRTEAETVRNNLGCPKSVDDDTVNAGSLYGGDLYGCILGAMQTVKLFINENSNKEVYNVKFLWNDWFKDMGFGIHSDKEEAQKALKVLIKLYAPEKAKEVDSAFFGNTSKTINSAKFVLEYTYDRGPAIDERMIVVTEK